jgi:hypothetical protein
VVKLAVTQPKGTDITVSEQEQLQKAERRKHRRRVDSHMTVKEQGIGMTAPMGE